MARVCRGIHGEHLFSDHINDSGCCAESAKVWFSPRLLDRAATRVTPPMSAGVAFKRRSRRDAIPRHHVRTPAAFPKTDLHFYGGACEFLYATWDG